MNPDDFVTIRRVTNSAEAEMMVDLLETEGIPASVPGNLHSAMLGGLAAPALQVPLQVPRRHAERALEILKALDDYDEIAPEDARVPESADMNAGAGPYRSARVEVAAKPPRKKGVAIASAVILPMVLAVFGAGHFYARSPGRGLLLLGLGWACVALALSGGSWAWLGLPVVVLADAVGAVSRIDGDARRLPS